MATGQLISALISRDPRASVDALHELLDDSMIEDEGAPITVAAASDLLGIPAHTLRYYEQEGLVRPERTSAGHRAYRPGDLRRLVFLTRMRISGMNMHDLKRYVELVEHGGSTKDERRAMMIDQRERILRQIDELRLSLEATEFKIRSYGGAPGI